MPGGKAQIPDKQTVNFSRTTYTTGGTCQKLQYSSRKYWASLAKLYLDEGET
jgi:hypothetical protein